jgi:hypothetical protein
MRDMPLEIHVSCPYAMLPYVNMGLAHEISFREGGSIRLIEDFHKHFAKSSPRFDQHTRERSSPYYREIVVGNGHCCGCAGYRGTWN